MIYLILRQETHFFNENKEALKPRALSKIIAKSMANNQVGHIP